MVAWNDKKWHSDRECTNNNKTARDQGLLSGRFLWQWTAEMKTDIWMQLVMPTACDVQCPGLWWPSACKCYTLTLSTRKSGNDASGLLPRLCGGKHTQTRMHNTSHQLIFVQRPLFIIFCFCLYSSGNRNESGGNAAYLRVYSRFASRPSGRGDFIHSKSNLPEQETDRHWPEFG